MEELKSKSHFPLLVFFPSTLEFRLLGYGEITVTREQLIIIKASANETDLNAAVHAFQLGQKHS